MILFGGGGPSEGLWVVVGLVEESVDGSLEIDDRAEDTALQASLGELGEKALDGVEPGGRGRGVVEDEARMAPEPGTDLGMLVRGIVVQDDVDDLANRHLGLDGVEEADELLMPVPLHTAADDLALEHVERGEQCRRAVALVVVRHGPTPAGLQGKARLGPVECLDLALLVDREHDRVRRRVDVEADDVAQLGGKVRVIRELELAHAVRLQATRAPDALHRADTDCAGLSHGGGRPMGRLAERIALRQRDHPFGDLMPERWNARGVASCPGAARRRRPS
jgi:hypothetical protein